MNLSAAIEKAESNNPNAKKQYNPSELFAGIEVDFNNRRELPTMLTMGENNTTLAIRKGLFTILGESKAGKSAVCDALIASAIRKPGNEVDSFGLQYADNPNKHAIIMFDTERGEYGMPQAARRLLRRAGRTCPNEPGNVVRPEWFYCYNLKKKTITERQAIVEHKLDELREKHGGIHLVLIDGLADFMESVNDEKEANALVKWAEVLADTHNTVLATVLHFNPGSDKGRGHFGSQLQRKCEGALLVKKEDGISSIKGDFIRFGGGFDNVYFEWSDDASMHVSCDAPEPRKKADKQATDVETVIAKMLLVGPLKSSEIVAELQKPEGLKIGRSKAFDALKEFREKELINAEGILYRIDVSKVKNADVYSLIPEEGDSLAVIAYDLTAQTDVPF